MDENILDSIEIYRDDRSRTDMRHLPTNLRAHCFLKLTETKFFLVGGRVKHKRFLRSRVLNRSAFIYDITTNTFEEVPGPRQPREKAICGVVKTSSSHSKTGLNRFEVVISGGSGNDGKLASTEIFNFERRIWTRGLDLPRGHVKHASSVGYGDSFLAVGGVNADKKVLDTILYFQPKLKSWIVLESRLETPRAAAVATLVPQSFCL